MASAVVIIDLDGVVADFCLGFTTQARRMYGTKLQRAADQPGYDLDKSMGLDTAQSGSVWKAVTSSPTFWTTLKPTITTKEFSDVAHLASSTDVYFVTKREGVMPKHQSEVWLSKHGIKHPAVVVVRNGEDKGLVAAAIGATHAIDDFPENIAAIAKKSPGTKCYLLDRPYNRGVTLEGVRRAKAFQDYLDVILRRL